MYAVLTFERYYVLVISSPCRYNTLVGVAFTGGATATGVAVNLGPTAQHIDLSTFGPSGAAYTSVVAASGTATAPINDISKLSIAQGNVTGGGSLTLPPFSIASWLMLA